jgi:Family of unknown function (DUF6228)
MIDPNAETTAKPTTEELVIGRPGGTTMSLGRPDIAEDGSGMQIPIRLSAAGLTADATIELEEWSGVRSFPAYFAELARAWRGWTGTKDWGDDAVQVSIRAVHDGVGLVKLTVSAGPTNGASFDNGWEARVILAVEPGELASLAAQIESLVLGETAWH